MYNFFVLFFSLNFQCTKQKNHFNLVIICYSFGVLADDAISNLAKHPNKEQRHAGVVLIWPFSLS